MDDQTELREILGSADSLSTEDKVKLIRHVTVQIERELKGAGAGPRRPLRGLWKGLGITHEEITEARREMWGDFPRRDL